MGTMHVRSEFGQNLFRAGVLHPFEVKLTELVKECVHDMKGKEAIDYELIDTQIDSVVLDEWIEK